MPPTHRELLVLEIKTRAGLRGMGYLQSLSGGLETPNACLREMIAPKILGRDATEIEGIWQTLWASTYWLGRAGIAVGRGGRAGPLRAGSGRGGARGRGVHLVHPAPLNIGYNRAAKLIEQMEKEGVVGPANHVGKREVLVRHAAED